MKLFSIKSIVLAFIFLGFNDIFNEVANGGGLDKDLLLGKTLIRVSTLVTVWVFLSLAAGNEDKAGSRRSP